MRISLFHPAFEMIGGAELLVVGQARLLQSLGAEVRIVTLAHDPARWAERLQGLPVEVIEAKHWSDSLLAPSRLAKLRRRARRLSSAFDGADAVLAYNHPASAMLGGARTAGRRVWQCNEPSRSLHMRLGNPTMTARLAEPGEELASADHAAKLAEYDGWMRTRKTVIARHRFDLEAVPQLDELYAISEFSRDNARAIYGRCREEVVYPIVRFPEGGRARRGLDRSGLKVLVHSRLEFPKNVDTVLRGVKLLRAGACGAAEVHVVGEGPARARLEQVAVELGLEACVRFHGFLSDADLRRVYEACDAFALLTLDEPFGMVYPEAAAKGLLLVGPDHGGPREILDDGRLGWCVDAFSPEALAEALTEIWSLGDEEVERRRAEADRVCRARFGAETIGPQLLRALRGS